MNVRSLKPSDIPILNGFVSDSKVKYPDLTGKMIEHVCVVVDANDIPIAACAAERIVQAWFYVSRETSPAVKLDALREIHQSHAIPQLRALMYTGLEAYTTGPKAASFGRRLERTFGWIKNCQSWTLRF